MSLCWNSWPLWLASFFSAQAGSFFRCGFSFFLWSLVRFNCACNSGVDCLNRPQGCLESGPLSLNEGTLHDSVDASSSTNPPRVPFLMCSCVLPSSVRFGPSRAKVGVGFRRVRLVQALPSFPPPPLVLFRCPSASAFLSFSCLSRVCPFRARCVVLVFSLSLFFCVPLFASWLSKFHFIFNLIFIFISSALLRWGVCVCVTSK